MPRPRTIFVDDDALVAGIRRRMAEVRAELEGFLNAHEALPIAERVLRPQDCNWARWELRQINERGVRIDFERFVGRRLTDSERIRHQQALRRLHAEGRVVLDGYPARRVKLPQN